MTDKSPTLYDRLGGEAAVEAAVVLLHDRFSQSPELLPFFAGFDLQHQLEVHISFVMSAFGKPRPGRAPDLRRAHGKLVTRGLGDAHFDAVISAMGEVLDELGVEGEDREQVLGHIQGTRAEVLGR